MTCGQLISYFNAFGDVLHASVNQYVTDVFPTGIVAFKQDNDVTKVLSLESHRILSTNVSVARHIRRQKLAHRGEQGKQDSATSLYDLNDDCLFTIFRMLSPWELGEVYDTS